MALLQALHTFSKKSQKSKILLWVDPVMLCLTCCELFLPTKHLEPCILAVPNSGQSLTGKGKHLGVFTIANSHSSFIVILCFFLSNLRLHPTPTNAHEKLRQIPDVSQSMTLLAGNPRCVPLKHHLWMSAQVKYSLLLPSSRSVYNPLALSEAAEVTLFVLLDAHKGHCHRTGAKVMFGTTVAPGFWADTAKVKPGPKLQENKPWAQNDLDAENFNFTDAAALAWGSEGSWVPAKLFK